jgi:hypothetical protein
MSRAIRLSRSQAATNDGRSRRHFFSLVFCDADSVTTLHLGFEGFDSGGDGVTGVGDNDHGFGEQARLHFKM